MVWFFNSKRSYLYTPEQLQTLFCLHLKKQFSDGLVYRVMPQPSKRGDAP